MSFIDKKDPVVLSIMLTSKGRELLSTGNLTFKYFAVGDSEIDYGLTNEINNIESHLNYKPYPLDLSILRPTNKNPQIISFVPQNITGNPYNLISRVPSTPYEIVNKTSTIGFFTNTGTTFITDSNHVKQPDAMVDVNGVTGGTKLTLKKAPTYGANINEPSIGDLLLVKWSVYSNTTGYTINKNIPTPYLTYQIVNKTGTLSSDNLIVSVDRNLPDFNGYYPTAKAGAMIYYNFINYSGATLFENTTADYKIKSVSSFLNNTECPTVVFPYWNMSIIYTEEIAGVKFVDRNFGQFNSRAYGGFVSYIQNQAPIYKKLGVIHYTNNSPANVYAEELYLKTAKLEIPNILWHKSSTITMGITLVPTGDSKLLTGETKSLNLKYYDLADLDGNIVGKVLTELKIFLIEDQELLFAMSYKSNRSWTLPNYTINT